MVGKIRLPGFGSSPLARGLRPGADGFAVHGRIIPARAGFTAASRLRPPVVPDHPRSRGVYAAGPKEADVASGSSPLARGLHVGVRVEPTLLGIIPARAGFTTACSNGAPGPEDHPRSRGVYVFLRLHWAA